MPLLKTWTEENGRWGIWQVTETLEELYACLSDDVVRHGFFHQFAHVYRIYILVVDDAQQRIQLVGGSVDDAQLVS